MEQIQSALSIVGIYVAINTLILFWLTNSIGTLRRKYKISVGDGGNTHLERAMRGHANAAENIPIFLIGLLVAALIGAPAIALHILGIVFCAGRIMHAHHFVQEQAPFKTRFIGFGMSALAMLVLIIGLLGHAAISVF